MLRPALGLFVAFAVAAPLAAGDVDPNPKSLVVPVEVDRKAKELIRSLANSTYGEREQAHRELRELGRLALPAIREGLATNASPEVQLRCELLQPRALGEDTKARVDCFLADSKSEFDHKLPGARDYFEIVGKSESSRNLFRELILSPNQLMLFAIGGTPDELAKAIVARRAQFRPYFGSDDGTGRPNPNAIDIAAILFAEGCVPDKLLPRNASQASQFLNQPIMRTALEGGANKDVYLALLTKWIDTREDTYSLYYAMNLSTSLKLSTGIRSAKKLLDAKTGPTVYRGMAMTFIAKNGDADDVKILEKYLTDKTVVTTTIMPGGLGGNRRISIQTRDIALAMCALLQKKDPADFGLTARTKSTNEAIKFNYSQHFIDDPEGDGDKKRDEAIKKYEEWKAAEKKKN